ncbi:hypothetical protein BPNSA17_39570 [Bordetella petrii]
MVHWQGANAAPAVAKGRVGISPREAGMLWRRGRGRKLGYIDIGAVAQERFPGIFDRGN